jgi:hypothetical protein
MAYVIFDLDGTLAVINHRLHLLPDWDAFFDACDGDEPNWPVIHTYQAIKSAGLHEVQVWSGRSDAVRDKTVVWLERYLGHVPALRMRRRNNYIADNALKEQWLDELGVASVSCVFDDRDTVVAMWRRRGVACFQVAPGDF